LPLYVIWLFSSVSFLFLCCVFFSLSTYKKKHFALTQRPSKEKDSQFNHTRLFFFFFALHFCLLSLIIDCVITEKHMLEDRL
jgi:hypothetical protein